MVGARGCGRAVDPDTGVVEGIAPVVRIIGAAGIVGILGRDRQTQAGREVGRIDIQRLALAPDQEFAADRLVTGTEHIVIRAIHPRDRSQEQRCPLHDRP